MICKGPFLINGDKQELLSTETERMLYRCSYRELDESIDKSVSWHWHSEIEIDYVAEGNIEFCTTEKSVVAHAGEMIFINSNVIHAVSSQNRQSDCKLYAHLFDISFLGGAYDSFIMEKYMLPIIKNPAFDLVAICKQDSVYGKIAENFLTAVELNRNERFGYELEVRTELSRIWLELLDIFRKIPEAAVHKNTIDTERMKAMISFIHMHYMEPITLKNIADTVNISSRECTRCFKRNIGTSPMKYLTKYRIQTAVQMLIQTSESILAVSESCGFSSGSYFGKVFHEIMGCTPGEFRKSHVDICQPGEWQN